MSSEDVESRDDWWNSSSTPNPPPMETDDSHVRPNSSEILLANSGPVTIPDEPDRALSRPLSADDPILVSQPVSLPKPRSEVPSGMSRDASLVSPSPHNWSASAYAALNNGPHSNSRSPSPYPSNVHHLHPSMSPKLNANQDPKPHYSDYDHPEWSTYHHDHNHKKVDRNSFKRNMTIAKGFLDISLLSANANQLKHLLNFGDKSEASFYVIKAGLITSLILQLMTGMLLILLERWNINKPHHAGWSLRLNNIIVCLVFLTLVINVMVSSFGVSVMMPIEQQQIPGDFFARYLNGSFRIPQ